MFIAVLVFCIFFVVKGFLVLDEELLIILASVLWVDAAGGLFREALNSELVVKGNLIKDKFVWFLGSKKTILVELLNLHKDRKKLPAQLSVLFNSIVGLLVTKTLINYYKHSELLNTSLRSHLVLDMASGLANFFYYNRLNSNLSLVVDSGSDILFLGKKNKHGVYGTTKNLVLQV